METSVTMNTLFLYILLVCGLADVLVQGDKDLRIEPDYNPFWVQVGTPFSVTCIKEAATGIPVVWTVKGGAPEEAGYETKDTSVTLANGQVRTSSLLTKDNVAVEDMGPSGLLCETDEAEDEREELFIGVNLFNVLMEHPNITEGEDVSLRCNPDTPSRVVWSRDGHVIDNNTERRLLQDENQTLVIQNSRPQDSGMYECKVLVMAGYDFHTKEPKEQAFIQHIPVSGKPYLQEKTSSTVEILINETLTVTCPVTAFPPPDVFWLREDDSPVQKSTRVMFADYNGVTDATLMISNLTKEDLGVYVCVAENPVGRMKKEFRVGLVGGALSDHAHAGLLSVFIGLCLAVLLMMF